MPGPSRSPSEMQGKYFWKNPTRKGRIPGHGITKVFRRIFLSDKKQEVLHKCIYHAGLLLWREKRVCVRHWAGSSHSELKRQTQTHPFPLSYHRSSARKIAELLYYFFFSWIAFVFLGSWSLGRLWRRAVRRLYLYVSVLWKRRVCMYCAKRPVR